MKARLISAVFEVNGEMVILGEGGIQVTPQPIDPGNYPEDGWTLPGANGCVGNLQVDEHLALMAVGDEYQREVAEKAANLFAVILPDCDYVPDVKTNLVRNYQQDGDSFTSGYLGLWMFEPFHAAMKRTRGGQVEGIGDPLPGYVVPIHGFNPYVIHKNTAVEYIKHLNRQAGIARNKAEHPNAPKASPRR